MNDFKPLNINKKNTAHPRSFFIIGIILGFFSCILLFCFFIGFVGNIAIHFKEDFPIETVPSFIESTPSKIISLQTKAINETFDTPEALVTYIAGDALYKFVEESAGCYQIVLIAKPDYVSVNSRDDVLGSHNILSDEELVAGYQLMSQVMFTLFNASSFSDQTLSVSVRLAGLAQYSSNPEKIEVMYDGAQGTLPLAIAQDIYWEGISLEEFRYLVSDYTLMQ